MTPRSSRAETSVVVIDDPTLFAEALRTALQLEGYDARWVAPEPAHVERDCGAAQGDRRSPQIAVLDLDLGADRDPLPMLRQLSGAGVRVVVVTASDDRGRWAECLQCGAARVLQKTLPLPEVLAVISRLHDGLPVMSDSERADLLDEWEVNAGVLHELGSRFALLTTLEQGVLARLMEGSTVHDIVSERLMAPAVIHSLVHSILQKLQVVTWLDAVSLTNEVGWTPAAWGD